LGGLNADIPEPEVDCLDPRVTQNCLSLSGFDGAGQYFELLCIGPDGLRSGSATIHNSNDPDGYITARGGGCKTSIVVDRMRFSVYVRAWEQVPAVFNEQVRPPIPEPVPLSISLSFEPLHNSPNRSTTSIILEMARMQGYARHTNDNGDPTDVLMEGAFASTWTGDLRLRGTLKAYF
jgi:hypothetical protein